MCGALLNEAADAAEKAKIVYTPFMCPIPALIKKEYTMKQTEANQFNKLYERHLRLLKLQVKSQKTIDAYSRSVRRIRRGKGHKDRFGISMLFDGTFLGRRIPKAQHCLLHVQ